MKGFSAYHISSRGLKYALAYSAFEGGEIEEADYKKALLNILTAQDFDSIPLVETYGGPITAIGRRRLHDGDLDDVFILSTEEVSKLPQTAPVIRCIFEVLSNEHHIVFLTNEDNLITDVVTISMLTSPLIQEYLTLLISKLTSEGWDFNEQHLNSAFAPTYDYPKTIHEELKKLGELVDHPKGVIPSDFDVSKQIVHILSLLQPLKLWEGGQESKALTSTDYPLKIVTPDYKPGTAGYFAQHPFGAVKEDGNEELAFRLFSEANNWDRLLLLSADEKYTHLLEQDKTHKSVKKIEILEFVWENTGMEDIVQIFRDDDRPICVNFVGSKYPGIITPQDVVFSENTKMKMMSSFVEFERHTRDTYMHYIGESGNDFSQRYWLSLDDKQKGPVWREGLKDVYRSLWHHLPEEMRLIKPNVMENVVISLRNSMAHVDFQLTPEEEIDSSKLDEYLLYLSHYYAKIQRLVASFERINGGVHLNAFANIFHKEYENLVEVDNSRANKNVSGILRQDFLNLKYQDGKFVVILANRSVEIAKKIRSKLHERDSIWNFEIADDDVSQQLRLQGAKLQAEEETARKAAEEEAARKAAEKAEAKQLAEEELADYLKVEIQNMLEQQVDQKNEISDEIFVSKIKEIVGRARERYLLTNQEVCAITGLGKGAIKGKTSILDWCGYVHSISHIHMELTDEKVRFRKIEFSKNEEE